MTLDEYQIAAERTAGHKRDATTRLAVAGMGLSGEAGEVLELVWGKNYVDPDKLIKELGDVCWYVAETASAAGLKLSELTIPPASAVGWSHGCVALMIRASLTTDRLKKVVGHAHALDVAQLSADLPIILGLVRDVARNTGVSGASLEEVFDRNIAKLQTRYKEGFSPEASLARADESGGAQ